MYRLLSFLRHGAISVFAAGCASALGLTLPAAIDPLLVTSTADLGVGTLRDAILAANTTCPRSAVIRFAVPGAGPHVIRPLTELPAVTCDGVIVDGYSQTGSRANSRADGGNDAAVKIVIDGSACLAACATGLTVDAKGSPIVRGLAIHSFRRAAIELKKGAEVIGNFLGTDPLARPALGGSYGLYRDGPDAIVGGSLPADANLVLGNGTGLFVKERSVIRGNLVTRNGTGVLVEREVDIVGNHVVGNSGAGVATRKLDERNRISMNFIEANGALGIDVGGDGRTANKPSPSKPTNFPVLTAVRHAGGDTVIEGTLRTPAGYAVIELFHNASLANAQGERPIAQLNAILDASGAASFSYTLRGALVDNVTATASADDCGQSCLFTSEFSAPMAASTAPPAPAPLPAVSLSPATLTFAARTVGSRSSAQDVTLANTGNAALAIRQISIDGDFGFASDCGASLAAGASCVIHVSFTPLTAGARTGSLVVASDAPGSPNRMGLVGTGQAAPVAVLDVSPTALDFAPVALGQRSDPQRVRLANSGTARLSIGSLVISGDFEMSREKDGGDNDDGCDDDLAPGKSCEVSIVFRPRSAGLATGLLQITHSASAQPSHVRLFGTGVAPTAGGTGSGGGGSGGAGGGGTGSGAGDGGPVAVSRALSLASRIAFEPQAAGSASEPRPLTLVNRSSQAISITDLGVTGDFRVSDACTTIAAGASCTVAITFTPHGAGQSTGTLTLRLFSESEPYVVALTGTAVSASVPALTLSATRIGFGDTFIFSAPSATVIVSNPGEMGVEIAALEASGDFAASHDCGPILASGASCTVSLQFTPRLPGGTHGGFEVRSNAAGSPHRVSLSGIGCALPSAGRARAAQLPCG